MSQDDRLFCGVTNTTDFDQTAQCTRKNGHQAHHCDQGKKLSWDDTGPIACPVFHDHGRPANRAARRQRTVRRPKHLARIRRNDGRNS